MMKDGVWEEKKTSNGINTKGWKSGLNKAVKSF